MYHLCSVFIIFSVDLVCHVSFFIHQKKKWSPGQENNVTIELVSKNKKLQFNVTELLIQQTALSFFLSLSSCLPLSPSLSLPPTLFLPLPTCRSCPSVPRCDDPFLTLGPGVWAGCPSQTCPAECLMTGCLWKTRVLFVWDSPPLLLLTVSPLWTWRALLCFTCLIGASVGPGRACTHLCLF